MGKYNGPKKCKFWLKDENSNPHVWFNIQHSVAYAGRESGTSVVATRQGYNVNARSSP